MDEYRFKGGCTLKNATFSRAKWAATTGRRWQKENTKTE
jgi:hypothetical protein